MSPRAASILLPTIFVLAFLPTAGCDSSKTTPSTGASNESVTDPATAMMTAIQQDDWATADRFAKKVLIQYPDDADKLTSVALVAHRNGRKREATELLAAIARQADFRPRSRVQMAAQGLVEIGDIYGAIELLDEALIATPEDNGFRRMLVGFLAEMQRLEKVPPHLKRLIQNREFDFPLLLAVTENSTRRFSQKTISQLIERNPDDHRLRLGNAFVAVYQQDMRKAEKILAKILDSHPDFAPAYAMYGQVLVGEGRWDEYSTWISAAPSEAVDLASYWLARGDFCFSNEMVPEAARCYWEATRRDPTLTRAWDQLRLVTSRLESLQPPNGETGNQNHVSSEQHQIICDYADRVHELRETFNEFAAEPERDQNGATEIAEMLLNVGRVWEAEAWSAAASTLKNNPSKELQPLRKKIVDRLSKDAQWFSRSEGALALDLSFLPLPKTESPHNGDSVGDSLARVIPKNLAPDSVRMSQQSDRWGLKNVCSGNNPDNNKLSPIIRSTGVGGGAIDFDLDGLPDLIAMNAGGKILRADSQANQLLRNVGGRFEEITQRTGVGDRHFGQGVAVGDFNEDGFPDLFFANFGPNVLLRNNGDGTFSDCSELLSGISGSQGTLPDSWSTSGSFVDMNGDGLSELFVTNYCFPEANIEDACPNEKGELGPCHPLMFDGDTDHLYSITDEGVFQDVTADWIGAPLPGRGLGIVAGAINGSTNSAHPMGLYVANDMSRNSFYSQQATSREDSDGSTWADTAATRGLALDGMARAQASMGIASSDFDLDGDLDFYVTGFGKEYNVYYEQVLPGLWSDRSSRLDLVQPTLMVIGFGAEAIDLDSDGLDEIIVTNGHIGQFERSDIPQQDLPLQIFRRNKQGKFGLVDDDEWGDYFRDLHVGRALWTTDVNVDGRNDVLVTHTNESVQLLVNTTDNQNHRIGFRLVGTKNSRDAVGSIIRFRAGQQERTLWMLSGDGYFCSNEKTLLAGLGPSELAEDVRVTWPDGTTESFGDLGAEQLHLIVQGDSNAFTLSRYR